MLRRIVSVLVLILALLTFGCELEVPGGEFPPTTPTPAGPTPTPVLLGLPQQLQPTNTPVPPPPTPTPRPPTPTPAADATPTEEGVEAEAVIPPADDMVLIPAGPFTMGYNGGLDDEKPEHEVTLPDYEIDLFEVTNAEFDAFVRATGYETDGEREGARKTWRDEWEEGQDSHPVVRVSWNDAQAYCEWLGKRLPTEAEWEKAARGPQGFLYPWGNEYASGRANGRDSGIRGTVAVGSYGEGVSPYGVFDMAGNVREWTADSYLPYPGNRTPSPFYGEQNKVLRGGGWFDDPPEVRATRRNASSLDAANNDIGFRCAR